MYYMHHTCIYDWPNSLEEMKIMIGNYVHVVINNLHEQFFNLPIFNASKLFNPKHYCDNDDHDQMVTWLMTKFTILEVNKIMC